MANPKDIYKKQLSGRNIKTLRRSVASPKHFLSTMFELKCRD